MRLRNPMCLFRLESGGLTKPLSHHCITLAQDGRLFQAPLKPDIQVRRPNNITGTH